MIKLSESPIFNVSFLVFITKLPNLYGCLAEDWFDYLILFAFFTKVICFVRFLLCDSSDKVKGRFTWSPLERNCIRRNTSRCIVSWSASSKSMTRCRIPAKWPSSPMLSEWMCPSTTSHRRLEKLRHLYEASPKYPYHSYTANFKGRIFQLVFHVSSPRRARQRGEAQYE